MKGYKIAVYGCWGDVCDMQIAINQKKATQIWNDKVRERIRANDCLTSDDFGEDIQSWKEDKLGGFIIDEEDRDRYEFLYAVAPIIVYKDKKKNRQIANVYYSYKSSYEYDEWDVGTEEVVLEEIEIVE